ncbi:MAG: sodium:alanine symporter family protein [Pseudomonadales bacterium]|nr:sodium:alanine symporter family protein [Pseudomonadales bacterium]
MNAVENILKFLDNLLGAAPYFPYVLLGVGLFFTFYLGFPQIRYFNEAWRILLGRRTRPDAEGDTSHFQALTTALSGTVGTGNIGGVAFAIFLGGPAALFWMWATAFLGMTTKFVEVTISHKYRIKDENGQIAGGPMYYMERGLHMKWLAIAFAAFTVISALGSGNLPQSNSLAAGVEASFGVPTWMTGLVLALLLGTVIIGGIRRIAAVTSKIVPFMGGLYTLGAFAVIASNIENVVPSFVSVFQSAFTGSAAAGGFLGASFAYAFNKGVNRGLFSNEAGQGSAPIAHAAARADEPASEGMVSLLEPFIDTLIICTLTGLVILSSGVWKEKFENDFQRFDTEFVEGEYLETNPEHVTLLFRHLDLNPPADDPVRSLNATLSVSAGSIVSPPSTVLHNRSIALDVVIEQAGMPYTGVAQVIAGKLQGDFNVRGKSLLHSVPLTTEAFKRSFLGDYGQYIVSVGLVLFAFSTAIAWSYYGDRAMTYLFGAKSVTPFRVVYVGSFFIAAIVDTTLVWLISAVTLALMALPNLFGIVLLRKEMKSSIDDYWQNVADQPDDP